MGYREVDGDFIFIENDDDLELCIEEAKENKQKPKFYLVEPGSDPLDVLSNQDISKTFIENATIEKSQKTEKELVIYPPILEEVKKEISEKKKKFWKKKKKKKKKKK